MAGALGSDGGEVAEELVGEAGEDDKLEAVGEARSHGAAPAAESVAHDARDAAGEAQSLEQAIDEVVGAAGVGVQDSGPARMTTSM